VMLEGGMRDAMVRVLRKREDASCFCSIRRRHVGVAGHAL
jgi:hypothetical protein